MKRNLPIVIGLGMALIAVVWYFMLGGKTLLAPASETPGGEVKIPAKAETSKTPIPPPATGNVDDAVNAILKDVATDIAVDEDTDAVMVGADGQAMSDFGQSYGENTF